MEVPISRHSLISSNAGNIADIYEFDTKTLGEGSFGFVKVATRIGSTTKRAVKVIPKKKVKNPALLSSEINIMKQIDHPSIIQLYENFEDAQYIYLVMEICEGGELFDKIIELEHFSEDQAVEIFHQIVSAISYLHSMNIVHRDLKPENFLIYDRSEDFKIKLIDFGLAKVMTQEKQLKSRSGTCYYIAPEIFKGPYDEKCDIWSLGIILFMILSGYPPFDGEDEVEIIQAVRSAELVFDDDVWDNVSSDAKDLISHMLERDPVKRYSCNQIIQHPWMNRSNPKSPLFIDINKLRQYQRSHKFKKAVLNYMATQCATEEIAAITELFVRIDTNKDGHLSIAEIERAVSEGITRPELQTLINCIDSDKNGTIDFTEFLAAVMGRGIYLCQEKLWNAFKRFDLNDNGRISAEEIQDVLDREHLVQDSKYWTDLILEADLNGDGTIDFEEFVKMMESGPFSRFNSIDN